MVRRWLIRMPFLLALAMVIAAWVASHMGGMHGWRYVGGRVWGVGSVEGLGFASSYPTVPPVSSGGILFERGATAETWEIGPTSSGFRIRQAWSIPGSLVMVFPMWLPALVLAILCEWVWLLTRDPKVWRPQKAIADRAGIKILSQVGRFVLPVGSIGGVRIALHWTWFVCLYFWVNWYTEFYTYWPWALCDVLGLFVLVLLHEFGHVLAAKRCGIQTKRVILWPLGGVAMIDATRIWRKELFIAVAGPAVNILLAPLLYLLGYILDSHVGVDGNTLLVHLLLATMGMAVFNLLPVFPLDGGRVLGALLQSCLGIVRSTLVNSLAGSTVAMVGLGWSLYYFDLSTVALLTGMLVINSRCMDWSLRMMRYEKVNGFLDAARCPHCHSKALAGAYNRCGHCGVNFNSLETCWNCQERSVAVDCNYCGQRAAVGKWFEPAGGVGQ